MTKPSAAEDYYLFKKMVPYWVMTVSGMERWILDLSFSYVAERGITCGIQTAIWRYEGSVMMVDIAEFEGGIARHGRAVLVHKLPTPVSRARAGLAISLDDITGIDWDFQNEEWTDEDREVVNSYHVFGKMWMESRGLVSA